MLMENRWSEPAGYEDMPPRIRYRIAKCAVDHRHVSETEIRGKDLGDHIPGEVVDRFTHVMRDSIVRAYFHALDNSDQHFADTITDLIQRACSYFYEEDWTPMEGVDFDWCWLTHCLHDQEHHNGGACQLCEIEHCDQVHSTFTEGAEPSEWDITDCEEDCPTRSQWEHEYRPFAVSDDDVMTRIHRIEQGENRREALRTGKQYYPIESLPFDQQRALVEQIEDHKRRWHFSIEGEDVP